MQSVTLSWTGDASLTYEVQFKKSTDSTWSEPSGSPVEDTSIVISDLEDSTDYNFRVRLISAVGNTSWVYQSYTTSTAGCSPASNLSIDSTSQTTASVSWDVSEDAVNGYIVQWKKSSALAWKSSPVLTDTAYTITGLTGNKDYDVKVTVLCAGSGSADSGIVHLTTDASVTFCSSISVTGVAVTAGTSSYTASWTNVGGTPTTHKLEYSTDGGTVWTTVTSISSQSLTSAIYNLPAVGEFPVTHQLRVIPKCSDNSYGTSDTDTYTQPVEPTEYVTIRNSSPSGYISFVNIDGSPNVLTSPIGPGGEKKLNQTDLLGSDHSAKAKLTGVVYGTTLTISHTRGVTTISSGYVIWNGFKFPIAINESFEDGDIFDIST